MDSGRLPNRTTAEPGSSISMHPSGSSPEAPREPLPRAFHIFLAGQGLSAIGDAMTLVALPLLVLSATGSVTQMGRLTALARVGGLLATAGAGFVVDRWAPRRVMLACDVARCLLMAFIPVAAALELRQLWPVFVVGIGAAFAQGIFYVGHVSLIAGLVGRARVSLANSRIEGVIALAYVFGPFVAGVLSARLGPAKVLGLDSLTFFVSVLALLSMGSRSSPKPQALPSSTRSLIGLVGLRFIRNQPELSRLTWLVAMAQLFTAAILDLFIFRLKHELGQGDIGTGVVFAVASVGAVLAALSTPWLRARFTFHRLWAGAVALQGFVLALSARAHSFASLAAAAAVYMATMTTLMICQASIRQELTPQPLLGRVTSSYLVLVALPTPVGALAATALAASIGAGKVQAGVGVGLLLTAALASAVWARMPKGEAAG